MNQIELHPSFRQAEACAYHDRHGIVTQAWSPLGHGGDLQDPTVARIAQDHDRSPAQVILRWSIQKGIAPVVKASNPRHMTENLAVEHFALSDVQMAAIDGLDRNSSCFGVDPRTFVAPDGMEDYCP